MNRIYALLLLSLIGLVPVAYGQQDPQLSLYMFNPVYYNPAAAGSEGVTRAQLMYRTQWTAYQGSFDQGGAPSTQMLSINAPLDKIRSGVGLYVLNDQFGTGGPQVNQAVQLSYAYRIPVKAGILALGVQAGLYSRGLNYDVFRPRDGGDPLLPNNGRVSQIQPDFGLGAYYHTVDYWIGASVQHLNEAKYNLGTVDGVNPNAKAAYFTAGYRLGVGYDIDVQPSVLLKTDLHSYSYEASVLATYQGRYSFGLSYRQADSVIGMVSWSFLENNAARLGFAYDFTVNGVKGKSPGSAELMLSYSLPAPNTRTRPIIRTPRFRY
jgi:type IX secretion system PorP/SprF family membrane protein